MDKLKNAVLPRMCIALILCFVAAYLTEKDVFFGITATFPFIVILPAFSYLIYRKALQIIGFCALGAFIFHCALVTDVKEILLFTAMCTVYGAVSVLAARYLSKKPGDSAEKNKKLIYGCIGAFVLSIVIYTLFHGTIFGFLSSKKLNEEYLAKEYPDTEFIVGSTYYSLRDRCYLTEFGFTDRERYTGLVSANKDGSAKHDGYRDYCEYRLLSTGLAQLKDDLSYHAYEGSDFRVRCDSLRTKDKITPDSSLQQYSGVMSYEIAFYDMFPTKEMFEEKCKEYAEHLSERGFVYGSIIFYGFDESDGKDFAYSLTHTYGSEEYKSTDFDSENYSRFFKEEDTHRYWSLDEV